MFEVYYGRKYESDDDSESEPDYNRKHSLDYYRKSESDDDSESESYDDRKPDLDYDCESEPDDELNPTQMMIANTHETVDDLKIEPNNDHEPELEPDEKHETHPDSWSHNSKYIDLSTEVMEKEGKIGIAVSISYGAFFFSDELAAALAQRGVVTVATFIRRTNKVLIDILNEGKIANDMKIGIAWIDKKYFEGPGFWTIDEYNGVERIIVDTSAYDLWQRSQAFNAFLMQGREILASEQDLKQKIEQITKLFAENP